MPASLCVEICMHAHLLYKHRMHAPNLNSNMIPKYQPCTNFFSFHSPSFVSRPLAEDGPAVDAPEADGSDVSSLLLLLGGGPGRLNFYIAIEIILSQCH